MKNMKSKLVVLAAAVTLAASTALAASPLGSDIEDARLIKRIRKQLVTLPFYGVFDNLNFKFDGDTVTLYGQTMRPSTRSMQGDASRK